MKRATRSEANAADLIGKTIERVIVDDDYWGFRTIHFTDGTALEVDVDGHDEPVRWLLSSSAELEAEAAAIARANAALEKFKERSFAAMWVPPELAEKHKNQNQIRPRPEAVPIGFNCYLQSPDAEPWPEMLDEIAHIRDVYGAGWGRENRESSGNQSRAYFGLPPIEPLFKEPK